MSMKGKAIYKGKSKTSQDLILRYPREEDLDDLLGYINTLSAEQTFIRFQGEQLIHEEEKEYLEKILLRIKEKKDIHILAFVEDQLVGKGDIRLRDKIDAHVGDFGLTIAKDYRGQGIGSLLLEKTINEAKKNLSGLKIISLGVFGDNGIAIQLYQKHGFVEYGRLPKGVFRQGQFVDHIYMYKEI